MNLKGKFKNIGSSVVSDLTIVAGIGAGKKALSFIPNVVAGKDLSPTIKGAGAYLLSKILLPTPKKGIMANVVTGMQLGFATVAASPLLSKIGIGGIDSSYVNGGDDFIRITKAGVNGNDTIDMSYVNGPAGL
jgi:hypothetical protein